MLHTVQVLPLRTAKRWILMPVPSVESCWERSANFCKNRNLPVFAGVGEMQILKTDGKTRLHIQQTASEPQLLMQPMRGPLLSIKSHFYGDLKDSQLLKRENNRKRERGYDTNLLIIRVHE